MEKTIKIAIENGFKIKNKHLQEESNYVFNNSHSILLDPLFWQALGRGLGWGEWNLKIEEVVHDWEIEHYQADTGKTPVYKCKTCHARKILNIIEVESESEWYTADSRWVPQWIVSGHGGKKIPSWNVHWHHLIDHLAEGGDIDSFFTNLQALGAKEV